MRPAKSLFVAMLLVGSLAAESVSSKNDDPAPWVSKRVEAWQPAPEERRFDDIGWVKDILEARRLSKEHNRPVFLFTHDGHMAVGRC